MVFFWSCEDGADGITGQDGTDGLSTILYTLDEPSGDNCANGGIKIVYGIDVNSDGVLSDSEIDNSTYICNGTDGQDAEVETEESLSPVGVWYLEGTGLITATLDENVVVIDTSYNINNINNPTNDKRLIITNDNYFHFSQDGDNNQIGNFDDVLMAGNCMIVDDMILVFNDQGEIIPTNTIDGFYTIGEWHYEIYESGNKLKLSNGIFPQSLVTSPRSKVLYVFYKQ